MGAAISFCTRGGAALSGIGDRSLSRRSIVANFRIALCVGFPTVREGSVVLMEFFKIATLSVAA